MTNDGSSEASNNTILVVDDHKGIRAGIIKFLSDKGYNVYEATDGQKGLEVVESLNYDVDTVLTDMRMPGYNGLYLEHALREKGYKGRIILMSAEDCGDKLPDCFDYFLQKPFKIERLLKILEPQSAPQ